MKYVKMGIVHDAWPWPLSDESLAEVIEMISELPDVEIFRMIAGLNPRGMTEGWLVKESGGGKPMLVSNFTFKQDYKLLSEILKDEQNAIPSILATREMIESMAPGRPILRTGEPDEHITFDDLPSDEEAIQEAELQRTHVDKAFRKDLAALINTHSLDSRCNMPDYLLARMIMEHLNSLEALLNEAPEFPKVI